MTNTPPVRAIAYYGASGERISTETPPAAFVEEVIRARFGASPTAADIATTWDMLARMKQRQIIGAVRFAFVDDAAETEYRDMVRNTDLARIEATNDDD